MKYVVNGKFLTQKTTGVQRYAREILLELDKLVKPGELKIAVPSGTNGLPEYQNIEIMYIGRLHGIAWEQLSFPIYAMLHNLITLNLCNVGPLLTPGITCLCDVKIKATPQYFSKKFLLWYRLLFWNVAKRAKKIITISEFSKREIIKYYGVTDSKIIVIPCAWQHFERIDYDENALNKYSLEKNGYLFSMFSLEPNKNFKWILEEAKRNSDQIFAVAGAINKKVFAKRREFEYPSNIKMLGYVSDEEAKTLMRDCKAFLFPTFYEGFGIPPLEAMSAGAKCVVVSDTEVMHEIFEDDVVYVDAAKCEYNLNELISEKDHKKNRPMQKYSWSKSAYELRKLLYL